jgi:hypothetical protein
MVARLVPRISAGEVAEGFIREAFSCFIAVRKGASNLRQSKLAGNEFSNSRPFH